jgi:dynein heavy chain
MEKILLQFYNEDVFTNDDYKFSPSGLYFAPKHTEFQGYIDYINSLPNFPEPECFGFHENAAITKNQNETNDALNTILICKSSAGGGGGDDNKDA